MACVAVMSMLLRPVAVGRFCQVMGSGLGGWVSLDASGRLPLMKYWPRLA